MEIEEMIFPGTCESCFEVPALLAEARFTFETNIQGYI